LTGSTHTADITAASLTVSTGNVSKTYDGGTSASGTPTVTAGTLYGSDSLSGGSYAFTDKNVGSGNKTVTVSAVTVNDGNSGANYSVSYANNTSSTITPFVINLSGSRKFDGTNILNADIFTFGSLVGAETLTLTGVGEMADSQVGVNKPVTLGTLALADGANGGLASNYTLSGGTPLVTILENVTPPLPDSPSGNVDAGTVVPNVGAGGDSNGNAGTGGGSRSSGLALSVARGTDSNRTIHFNMVDTGVNSGGSNTGNPNVGTNTRNDQVNLVHLLSSQTLDGSNQVNYAANVEINDYNSGFSFSLPAGGIQALSGGNDVSVRLASGESLPSWIKFNPSSMNFSVDNVNSVQFPLQILITQASVTGQTKSFVVTIDKQGKAI
ncbi:YDG domain-containing protein, partial [Methylomonas sp. SURF-1]